MFAVFHTEEKVWDYCCRHFCIFNTVHITQPTVHVFIHTQLTYL